MPAKKEKIKNLMIALLEQDGVASTILNDSGKQLTVKFNPDIISMEDLYDLAQDLRDLDISISYMNYSQ